MGHDRAHLTFFEMLGNFSFGDYFKAEAVAWAYELVTEGFGIDPDRLWVTVFERTTRRSTSGTRSACRRDRIVRRGLDEGEFATTGHTHAAGPGGPCSEIFVDRGPKYGPEGGPDVDEERFMEIWNLVFIQDEVDDRLEVVGELPAKNVDTGSSLERVAMVLQDVDNVFETDLLRPLLEVGESLSGRTHGADDRTRRVAEDRGRARAGDDVPDRRRCPAVERGPRLRPAPDAPPGRLARPAARDRAGR